MGFPASSPEKGLLPLVRGPLARGALSPAGPWPGGSGAPLAAQHLSTAISLHWPLRPPQLPILLLASAWVSQAWGPWFGGLALPGVLGFLAALVRREGLLDGKQPACLDPLAGPGIQPPGPGGPGGGGGGAANPEPKTLEGLQFGVIL